MIVKAEYLQKYIDSIEFDTPLSNNCNIARFIVVFLIEMSKSLHLPDPSST